MPDEHQVAGRCSKFKCRHRLDLNYVLRAAWNADYARKIVHGRRRVVVKFARRGEAFKISVPRHPFLEEEWSNNHNSMLKIAG